MLDRGPVNVKMQFGQTQLVELEWISEYKICQEFCRCAMVITHHADQLTQELCRYFTTRSRIVHVGRLSVQART